MQAPEDAARDPQRAHDQRRDFAGASRLPAIAAIAGRGAERFFELPPTGTSRRPDEDA